MHYYSYNLNNKNNLCEFVQNVMCTKLHKHVVPLFNILMV